MITGSYSFRKGEQCTIVFKKDILITRRLEDGKTILEISPQ